MSKQLLLVKLLQLLVLFLNLQIDENIMPTRYRTTEVHTVDLVITKSTQSIRLIAVYSGYDWGSHTVVASNVQGEDDANVVHRYI